MKGTKKDICFAFCYLNGRPLEQKNPLFQELIGLFIKGGGIIIMIYTETLSTVILSVCNLIFSTNKETIASFGKMFNVS